jgi:hypothetical protein
VNHTSGGLMGLGRMFILWLLGVPLLVIILLKVLGII